MTYRPDLIRDCEKAAADIETVAQDVLNGVAAAAMGHGPRLTADLAGASRRLRAISDRLFENLSLRAEQDENRAGAA